MTRVVAVILLCGPIAAQVEPFDPAGGKISGEILRHRELKARPPAMSDAEYSSRLARFGLDRSAPDSEECALYVEERFGDAKVAELAGKGIDVNTWAWIPPVRARHRFGYYLARIRYDALSAALEEPSIVRVESLERRVYPWNDVSGQTIGTHRLHDTGLTGAGVKVAICDSGIDTSLADIPTPVEGLDVNAGDTPAEWSRDTTDSVGHGTHVTATAVGRGTLSGGRYRGSAPGAELYFYKNGEGSLADVIKAIHRATEVGCDILSLSLGGPSPYMDGSSPECQAVDAASAAGMACFVAAGNIGDRGLHAVVDDLAPDSTRSLGFTVDNRDGGIRVYNLQAEFRLIWRAGPLPLGIELKVTNLSGNESLSPGAFGFSPRETRARNYSLSGRVPGGEKRTYVLALTNTSTVAVSRLHIYDLNFGTRGAFDEPDPKYTVVDAPALADTALAVGAWTSRNQYVNWRGETVDDSVEFPLDALAPFSSRGPRIDGWRKPDFAAPGVSVISSKSTTALFLQSANARERYIDDDGQNLNGTGPANYIVFSGTSMATPLAAGAAALLKEKDPTLTPAQLRFALQSTASNADAPDTDQGHGLINVLAALAAVEAGIPDDCDPAVAVGGSPDENANGILDTCEGSLFVRGDCNADGDVNLSDAVCVLGWLFAGAVEPGCVAALNTNGDSAVGLADPVFLLNFLFAGGAAPVQPFPECGFGVLADDEALGCANSRGCR